MLILTSIFVYYMKLYSKKENHYKMFKYTFLLHLNRFSVCVRARENSNSMSKNTVWTSEIDAMKYILGVRASLNIAIIQTSDEIYFYILILSKSNSEAMVNALFNNIVVLPKQNELT